MAISKRAPLDFSTVDPRPVASAVPAAAPADKDERQQVGARVKTAVYRQLKARAAMDGVKVQELVERAIIAFLGAE